MIMSKEDNGSDPDKDKGGKGDDKKVDLIVSVSGDDVEVKAKIDDTLESVAEKALKKGEHLGRPLSDWVLRDAAGQVLELTRTVSSYGMKDGDVLSLTLEAGVAG
jgi:hypothetical protein